MGKSLVQAYFSLRWNYEQFKLCLNPNWVQPSSELKSDPYGGAGGCYEVDDLVRRSGPWCLRGSGADPLRLGYSDSPFGRLQAHHTLFDEAYRRGVIRKQVGEPAIDGLGVQSGVTLGFGSSS
ncbi:uncharacterized protein A4U43_C04F26080 [Asparagus officinalis]|uniref:Uncharacterized protein n=1 Tax=Asparagus officinalis TaxID=4686 RepID=A0A5P1F8D3_ASPOF|nr:uncharacterized protein A4U43_C04F26080 [Asparagus officinalis]